jgi:hypothetical protein
MSLEHCRSSHLQVIFLHFGCKPATGQPTSESEKFKTSKLHQARIQIVERKPVATSFARCVLAVSIAVIYL